MCARRRLWSAVFVGIALVTSCLVVGMSAVPARAAMATDWPLLGFDAQNDAADPSETSISVSTVGGLRSEWASPGATDQRMPVVAGGRVITTCASSGLCALDARTGTTLWSGGLGYPVGVVNGVVYSDDPNYDAPIVYGTDLQTGRQLWTFSPPGNQVGLVNPEPNGILYVGSAPDGWLYAVSETTRAILWQYDVAPRDPYGVQGTIAGGSVALSGNTLFYDAPSGLLAFNATTGALLWTGTTTNFVPRGQAVVTGSRVLEAGTLGGQGGVASYPVGGCGQSTCAATWASSIGPDLIEAMAAVNGVGYAVGAYSAADPPNQAMFVAFSLTDGSIRFRSSDTDVYGQGSGTLSQGVGVVAAGDLVWYGTNTGQIAAMPAAGCGASTCTPVWTTKMTNGWGELPPIVVDGVVYAAGDGGLTAFTVPGEPSSISSPPTSPSPTVTATATTTTAPSPSPTGSATVTASPTGRPSDSAATTSSGAAPTAAASSPSSTPTVQADTSPPRLTMSSVPVAELRRSFSWRWTVSDDGTGTATVDARYRRTLPGSDSTSWRYPTTWQHTSATAVTLTFSPGTNYCVEVRARDHAGNVSTWSSARCVTRPLDDRALIASPEWDRRKSADDYLQTDTTTSRHSARLTLSSTRLDRLGVVATRCPGCGTIGLYAGSTLIGRVSLNARTVRPEQILLLPRFRIRTASIQLRVLSTRRPVHIDGLVCTPT